MENYCIKNNSISVGFNPKNGQEFFDTLLNYYYWIHDWFFSLNYGMMHEDYSEDKLIELISGLETYGIPANLLLNSKYDYPDDWKRLIPIMKDKVNLKAITFLDIKEVEACKKTYPDIDIHLSVRYFDYLHQNKGTSMMDLLHEIIDHGLHQYIDYVNISGAFGFVNKKFSDLCHQYGMKTKYILTEGCLINRYFNYNKFPNFCTTDECSKETENIKKNACSQKCRELLRDYPWTMLCWNSIYKEIIGMCDFDIIKLSTRASDITKLIKLLEYVTTPTRTVTIEGKPIKEDRYPIFLEYCKYKLNHCKGDCMACQMCKDYYERIFEE